MASTPDASGALEGSRDFGVASSPKGAPASGDGLQSPTEKPKELRLPTLRPLTETSMTASSTVTGSLNNARGARGQPPPPRGLPSDIAAKMAAFAQSRANRPPISTNASTGSSSSATMTPSPGGLRGPGGVPAGFAGGVPPNFASRGMMPPGVRPTPHAANSAPAVTKSKGLRRGAGLTLTGMGMGLPPGQAPAQPAADGTPAPVDSSAGSETSKSTGGSAFDNFKKFVDTDKGTLNFSGKAVIHGDGIDFSNGKQFNISLDEVDTLDELGKGNYGTVYKVRHSRPRMRKVGQGLAGNKASSSPITPISSDSSPIGNNSRGTTGIIMAMKEIRLELDEAKFAAIIMELDILHRCVSPYIIDFYGAFFQEGAVYICIEFMDGGSIDKIYGDGVPENVLRKITYATTRGLRELKDVHNIIHRDVKPTNILVNTRGQVKICDFGVSGNLVASIAKTNIGCQSYMAPERISGGGMSAANSGGGTYSVQSDIWSLGLSIIECAMGRYPYPPETYNNIFSQLNAIVEGEPPNLPDEGYSSLARDFVRGCLNKVPKLRPTYSALLAHPWLAPIAKPSTITEEDEELAEKAASLDISSSVGIENGSMGDGIGGENKFDLEVAQWCQSAIERKRSGKMGFSAKPALHAAPLDSTSPIASPAA